MFDNSNILITGGTGSFGKKFVKTILSKFKPKKIIIFSRDEVKQYDMQSEFQNSKSVMQYVIGDVRDYNRLSNCMLGVDYIMHAAALKQVVTAEHNPSEYIKTNIYGT